MLIFQSRLSIFIPFSQTSRPWTPEEGHHATAVPDELVEAVLLGFLVRLPPPQLGEEDLVLHDEVEVQPEEHRHPRLRELVVPPGHEPRRQGPDEVEELVRLALAGVAYRHGPELEVGAGRRQGL